MRNPISFFRNKIATNTNTNVLKNKLGILKKEGYISNNLTGKKYSELRAIANRFIKNTTGTGLSTLSNRHDNVIMKISNAKIQKQKENNMANASHKNNYNENRTVGSISDIPVNFFDEFNQYNYKKSGTFTVFYTKIKMNINANLVLTKNGYRKSYNTIKSKLLYIRRQNNGNLQPTKIYIEQLSPKTLKQLINELVQRYDPNLKNKGNAKNTDNNIRKKIYNTLAGYHRS